MKKNLFWSMLAMSGMLFATSCSQDELVNESTGEFVDAKFKIATPDGIGTRAAVNVGLGTTVNYVACAVYDADGEELTELRQYRPITDKQAEYSIRLVKGQAYRVAFFAYCGNNDGSNHFYNLGDMTNITINNAGSNLEERDAFTNHVDVTEEESMKAIEKPVTLYRPFAQLNLGAYDDDIEAARKADVVVTNSKITVSNVYTAFNAYSDQVVGDASEVTFTMNVIPGQDLAVDTDNNENTPDETFEYLALNYLLVGDKDAEKNLTDVTFEWKAENGKTNSPATVFKNIPVQRNYRTNIIGYLLTNPAEFNITIDEKFKKPDYNVIYAGGTAANPDDLKDSMDDINDNAVKNAVIKIPAGAYVSWTTGAGIGSTPLVEVANKVTETVTIQGEGESSVLVVEGSGVGALRAANGAKLIFKDMTILDKSVSYAEGAWEYTYLEFAGNLEFNNVIFKSGIQLQTENNETTLNATFNNCTFITEEESVYGVWVSDGTSTFSNCKFQGTRGLKMHEAYGSEITSVTIDGCAFGPLSKKPGVAIGDLNATTAVTIKNSSFNGCQADDQGNYIYETDTDVTTFTFVNENNTINHIAATLDQLNALLNDANVENIQLAAGDYTIDLYDTPSNWKGSRSLTIKGVEGTKVKFAGNNVCLDLFDKLTIVDCEILHMATKKWGMLVFSSSNNASGVYTVSNCTFNGVGTQGIYINENTSGATYNILNCTFDGDFGTEGAITIQTNKDVNHIVNVMGCTFNNIPDTSHRIFLASWDGKGSFYYGWTLNTDLKAYSAYDLAMFVALGKTNIDLADGEYDVYGCAGKTLTLNGSANAILKLYNDGEDGCDYAFGGNGTGVGDITFNGLTINTESNTGNYKGYAYMKGTFNNCNFVGAYSLNNANDFIFNGCTFDFKNGYFWTWGAKSVTFDGCTFNGNSKNILAHGYASTQITINDCTFAATEVGKTGAGDPTACVEIDPAGTNVYTINFTGNNTKSDNYAGWTRIKDGSTGHTITGIQ